MNVSLPRALPPAVCLSAYRGGGLEFHGLRGGSIVVVGLDGEGRLLVESKKEEAAQNAQKRG